MTPEQEAIIKQINEMVSNSEDSKTYMKSAETLGRIPSKSEIGKEFPTYVKKDGKVTVETTNKISDDVVIARNPEMLDSRLVGNHMFEHTEERYNEWLVPKETWLKNYGQLPLAEKLPENFFVSSISPNNKFFQPMKKTATLQAMKITKEVFAKLAESLPTKDGQLVLPVSWSDDGMLFGEGDYISNQGYSLNEGEMEKTYEEVKSKTKKKSNKNQKTSKQELK